jgi:TonB-linked SusC/RagA family outer membrane protein
LLITVCSISFLCAETAYGQGLKESNISYTAKKRGITEVFSELGKQTGVHFFYDESVVENVNTVTIQINNGTIDAVLHELAEQTGLQFKRIDNTVSVSRNPFARIPASTQLQQVKKLLTGSVTDDRGEPIIGANVVEKGTTNGTITDIDGRFSISAGEQAILQISYIGYVNQEIVVKGRASLSVILKEDSQTLNEVVVVGYGTQKKVNLSGAVESVSARKLESRSTNNIGLALQGVVPNLTIDPGSGQANATPSYNIRGMTSLNGGSPLIIVDGVPTDPADFSRMNTADIENLSVIKDASSAAIYGARAAYGVILVTTKKGKTDKLTIQFNNNFNIRTPGRMPEVVLDPYIQASYKLIMGQPWYTLYDEQDLAYAKQRSEDRSLPEVIPHFKDPERWRYFGATDWYKEVFRNTGTSNSHNINISGMTKNVSYYLATEYYNEKGLLRYNTDDYDKVNIRSHIEYKPYEWLSVGNNTSLQYHIYNRPHNFESWTFSTMHSISSLYPVKNPDDTWTTPMYGGTIIGNLVGTLQNGGQAKTTQYTTQTQFDGAVSLLKDVWKIKADFTAKYASNKENTWDSDKNIPSRSGPNLPVEYYGWDNFAQVSTWNKLYTMTNVYSDFSTKMDKHSLSVLAGFSQEYERYEYVWNRRKDLISDAYPTPQLAVGEMTIHENVYEWAIRSGFFRLNYILNDRYIFEVNGRYDGTSRFPKKDRFGFFPSFSGAWIVSEESFFKPLKDMVTHSKIRLSYGTLGNQDVNYYQYISEMTAGKVNVLLNGERPMGIYTSDLVSNSLTWEKVYTMNLGLDVTIWNNKLAFSGDIYRRDTKDMLMKGKTLPNVLGTDEPKINAADLTTNGWEFSLMWNDHVSLQGKRLNYSARFILSDSRSHITKFDNPTGYLNDYYEGQELGEIWGMETEGFFVNQADIDSHANQWEVTSYPGDRPLEPGDLKYKDLNGDGKINKGSWTKDDPGDFKVIGNSSNRYNFGIDLGADCYGFDIRMLLQGVGKKDWYPSGFKFFGLYTAPWANVLKNTLDHWTPENPNAYFPRLKSYIAEGGGGGDLSIPQTRYLQNAAYMRMKNITIGYTIPPHVLDPTVFSNIRVYLSGENLFEITKLSKNYDPEGLNNNTHPFQRTYSIGLNVTF